MTRHRLYALSAMACASLLPAHPATAQLAPAQPTPLYLCQTASQAAQQGGPGLHWVFGQQLLQLVMMQTGGTGVSPVLLQLGPVMNIVIGGVNQLPNGTFVACRVYHVNGYADWQIGYSPYSQRIENINVIPYWTAVQTMPQQQPMQQPASPAYTAPPIQPPPAKSQPPPAAPTQSEACKKFPNLC